MKARFGTALAVLVLVGLALVLLVLPATGAPSFPDVPSNHPYAVAISDLASRGIISGYTDGAFRPESPVTRQQFAKMIVLTLGFPVSEADICPFGDVEVGGPGDLYPDNYVAVAAARGITVGTGPGLFSPGANISRYQVITMVVRGANVASPGLLTPAPTGFAATWDVAASGEHGQNARLAEYNGLLAGLPLASLDPWASMSRGEVAQVLYNLLGKLTPPTTTWTFFTITITVTTSTTTTTAGTTTTAPPPARDLIYLSRRPGQDWTGKDISILTGRQVVGPAVEWTHSNQGYELDHLAARGPAGDLLVFWETVFADDWQAVDVTALTGRKVAGDPTYWSVVGASMATRVDHLAARGPDGHLLHFWWTGAQGWQAADVTAVTGESVAGPLTSWANYANNQYSEYVAGPSPSGDLLVFYRAGGYDWRVTNVTQLTGQKVQGPLSTWGSGGMSDIAGHIGAVGPTGDLLDFWRTSATTWTVFNVSDAIDRHVAGPPSFWWTNSGGNYREHLAVRGADGHLLHVWRQGGDWAYLEDLTDITGNLAGGDPAGWWDGVNGGSTIAAVDPDGNVLHYWLNWHTDAWEVDDLSRLGPHGVGSLTYWLTGRYSGAFAADRMAFLLKD